MRCQANWSGVRRARHGGLATQLVFAGAHLGMHLTAAISLMLLLELATETCIRCVQACDRR